MDWKTAIVPAPKIKAVRAYQSSGFSGFTVFSLKTLKMAKWVYDLSRISPANVPSLV
jgi:hypothetical protein